MGRAETTPDRETNVTGMPFAVRLVLAPALLPDGPGEEPPLA
ncbi:MAG TPA: hypothetical protein VKY56_10700 [Chloroflexota bacterium]|nr:hypothetical protein [Chloroflexota bacterium]